MLEDLRNIPIRVKTNFPGSDSYSTSQNCHCKSFSKGVQCKLDFLHGKQLYMNDSQAKVPLCTPILCIPNVNGLLHVEMECIHYEAARNYYDFSACTSKQCNLSQNCYSFKKRTLNLRPQPAINSFGEKQTTHCKPVDIFFLLFVHFSACCHFNAHKNNSSRIGMWSFDLGR